MMAFQPMARAATAPSVIQMKTRIGPVDDPLEREADRIADAVVSDAAVGEIGATAPAMQRKCAACENEENTLRRKCGSCAAEDGRAAELATRAVSGGGARLSPGERAYFEPRFGRDLSAVRIHTDPTASAAANALSARAYTLGSDIAFAKGEFAPGHHDGRKLIAHELAHVAQQVPGIARQPAPYHSRTFQDRSGGGTTDFVETVQIAPAPVGAAIQGTVDRSEVAPASATQPQQTIHAGQVRNIQFDQGCFITVPFGISFQQQPVAAAPFCQEPPSATPVAPLAAAQMQALQTRYIDALNDGLNGWYAVRVEGCRNQPCTGQPIPIRITAAAVANNPDLTINVVNRGGRGNAGTICVGDFNAGFAAHEGGHQVLGLGDEYRESDPALRQRVPLWARDERVRTDLTRMGSDSDFRRFALYHERHFRFAQVFLEAVYRGQGCTVTLEAVRSPPVDFRIDLGLGYASASTGTYLSATGFLGVGVPLERQRRLTLLVGAQGQLLESLAIPDRRAFLLGARLGLEGQTTPGSFGLSGNISASGGVLHQPESTPPPFYGVPPIAGRTSPYGELSAGIGIQSGLTSGVNFRFGVEAAAGRELSNDPNAMRWLRFGFNVGAAF